MTTDRHAAPPSLLISALLACGLALAPATRLAAQPVAEFTDRFHLEDCTFSNLGGNPFFTLDPGHTLLLEGEEDGETETVLITALQKSRWIKFQTPDGITLRVRTRVIEERETVDDELVEVSRNFFARCRETNDVFYFGEDVDIYEDGEIVSHDGAWLAGRNGAQPGLIMPGTFLLGSRYFQEMAPGALDRAEHVAMGFVADVPAGPFPDCVRIVETSPLEPGDESVKVYCPGIGLVDDDGVELVEVDDDGD